MVRTDRNAPLWFLCWTSRVASHLMFLPSCRWAFYLNGLCMSHRSNTFRWKRDTKLRRISRSFVCPPHAALRILTVHFWVFIVPNVHVTSNVCVLETNLERVAPPFESCSDHDGNRHDNDSILVSIAYAERAKSAVGWQNPPHDYSNAAKSRCTQCWQE